MNTSVFLKNSGTLFNQYWYKLHPLSMHSFLGASGHLVYKLSKTYLRRLGKLTTVEASCPLLSLPYVFSLLKTSLPPKAVGCQSGQVLSPLNVPVCRNASSLIQFYGPLLSNPGRSQTLEGLWDTKALLETYKKITNSLT